MEYLIVLRGQIGVGKTTLANSLGARLKIPVIDKDDVKDVIDPSFADTREAGRLSYEVMWRIAEKQLMNGLSVICDSPLSAEFSYQKALQLAGRFGVKLIVIDCECPAKHIWRKRLETRLDDLSFPSHRVRTLEEIQTLLEELQATPKFEVQNAITVDTSQDLAVNLDRILFYLTQH